MDECHTQSGIDTIKGSIIAMAKIFDYDLVPGDGMGKCGMDYGAPPSGLCFRDNLYDIKTSINNHMSMLLQIQLYLIWKQQILFIQPFIYKSYAYAAGPPF